MTFNLPEQNLTIRKLAFMEDWSMITDKKLKDIYRRLLISSKYAFNNERKIMEKCMNKCIQEAKNRGIEL